jgi:CDGSH-type Zn-finger protein
MADVTIKVSTNGPYLVTGPIELVDADGKPLPSPGRKTVALCRCGGSTTKPYCDGTHSRIGFQGAMRAVEEAQE